jgi:excisionase family DNA binding protein
MERIERAQDFTESGIGNALDKLADSIRGLPQDRKEELEKFMAEKKIYTVEELAKILKLSPLTVRRAIKEGKIKVIRLGSTPKAQIRITEAEVDKILSEGM